MTVKIIIFLASVTLMDAHPVANPPDLLTYSSSRSDNGYDFSYSTHDQTREEHGVLLARQGVNGPESVLEVHGSYSFVGDDGLLYTVTYVAGVTGYRANVSISVPETSAVGFLAPIAPEVLKSLVG